MRACAGNVCFFIDNVPPGLSPSPRHLSALGRAVRLSLIVGKCSVLAIGPLDPGQLSAHARRNEAYFNILES
eukprot:7120426-Pyramimonas_sp.AAC.1